MKKTIGIIVLVVLVVLGGIWIYQREFNASAESAEPQGRIVTVRRGTIEATVNATGVIQPERQAVLTFKNAGRLEALYVEAGESVIENQILAQLETEDLRLQVRQAEIALRIAEHQAHLTQSEPTEEDLATAKANLEAARENLSRLSKGATESQLAAAKASLESAQAQYDRLVEGPSEDEIRRAKLAIDQAKNSLWGAQNARDSAGYSVKMGGPRAQLDQAEAQVLNAEIAVELAEMSYQDLLEGASASEILAAEAQLEQARETYEGLLDMPRESEIASAEAQIRQAEATLAKLRRGASEEEMAIAQEQVEQAQVSLEQAQLLLEGSELRALFDGVITTVNVEEGTLVSAATPAMSLMDLSGFRIEVSVDEIDVPLIEEGQLVRLTLDSLPDTAFTGRVSRIAEAASTDTGITAYPVEIEIGSTDVPLKVGMTATAEIMTQRKEGVLLVPNRAIRIDRTDRTYHVQKWADGEIVDTQIVPGMRNETVSEVVSGLEEGTDLIIRDQSFTDRFSENFGE
jgi:HlyD family secretion protein